MSAELLAAGFSPVDEEDWRALVTRSLGGRSLESLAAESDDGIPVGPIYRQDAPGTGAGLARSGRWRIVQRIDAPNFATARQQILDDLANAVTGLHLVFASSPAAFSGGLPHPASGDLARLFHDVPLDGIALSIDAGTRSASIATDLLQALRPERVTVACDPIAALAVNGPSAAVSDAVAEHLFEASTALEKAAIPGSAVIVDGRFWHAAGASGVQELAVTIAAKVAYLRAFEANGISPAQAMSSIGVALAADADQFLTMAKFRAARLLLARLHETLEIAPIRVPVHAETAWRMMTQRDPHTNILRTTIAAFSAGIAGADSIAVLPFDSARGPAKPFARRIARNTQLILLEEANLTRVADPGAGSGAIEALTEALAEKAWDRFRQIEAAGGLPALVAAGSLQREVAAIRDARLRRVMAARVELTGTNAYPDLDELPPPRPDGKQSPQSSGATLLTLTRLAEPFERLRDRADALAAAKRLPAVFLARLGHATGVEVAAAEAGQFLAAGGIRTLGGTDFGSSEAAAACICADTSATADEIAAAAASLRNAGARFILLAGQSGASVSGANAVIEAGANRVEILEALLTAFENTTQQQ